MTIDEIVLLIVLFEEDPEAFAPDSEAKERAIRGALEAIETHVGGRARRKERLVDGMKPYDPVGHEFELCLDPGVPTGVQAAFKRHLRRADVWFLDLIFSDFTALWAAEARRVQLRGDCVVQESWDLDELPPDGPAEARRVLIEAAERHGLEWMPRATREHIPHVAGFSPWPLRAYVLDGAIMGQGQPHDCLPAEPPLPAILRDARGRKLWVDGERLPPAGWVHARTAAEAIRELEAGHVAVIALDHDLGASYCGTGHDVARFIEEQAFRGTLPRLRWWVRAVNPIGRAQMVRALENADRFWRRR